MNPSRTINLAVAFDGSDGDPDEDLKVDVPENFPEPDEWDDLPPPSEWEPTDEFPAPPFVPKPPDADAPDAS